ncbi:MAG: hypothetical protein IPM80_03715 [Proteobacteria bacterium]|nr:hypothetical protein [Pseudomonadota bacterium]
MSELPACPECRSEFAYRDADHLVCPECGHEWSPHAPAIPRTLRTTPASRGAARHDPDQFAALHVKAVTDAQNGWAWARRAAASKLL